MGDLSYKLSEINIDEIIGRFEEKEKYKEAVLKEIFEKYKTNKNLNEVLIKVTVLNSLYSAGLNNNDGKKTIDVVTMARHIQAKSRLDDWLSSENEEDLFNAYYYIACGSSEIRSETYNNCYAFASKYCSWQRPEVFPIMDSRAKKNLSLFIKENPISIKEELIGWEKKETDYKLFWSACKEFQKYINGLGNRNYNMKKIDEFLWEYGRPDDEPVSIKEEVDGGEQ